MDKSNESKQIRVLTVALISFLLSVAANFLLPPIMNMGIGKGQNNITLYATGLAALCGGALCLVAFLRFSWQEQNKKHYGKAFGKMVATILILVCVAFLVSLLSGLISVLLYDVLKSKFTVDQIKGILDYLIAIIILFILPFPVSIFWQEVKSEKPFRKSLIAGLKLSGKVYLKLLIVVFAFFGFGILITTVFHYMASGILVNIIKAILFAAVGTAGLEISNQICKVA